MKKLFKILWTIIKIFTVVAGILYAIYFWNLDQKLLGWAYVQVNKIFDRKKTDIKF